ncbi:MAG: sortase, partial [Aquificales bacterium]|nr:sortase [Aquificales bacterium]
ALLAEEFGDGDQRIDPAEGGLVRWVCRPRIFEASIGFAGRGDSLCGVLGGEYRAFEEQRFPPSNPSFWIGAADDFLVSFEGGQGILNAVEGRPPEAGEAGDIPAHLLPAINAYIPPPLPTPGPEQARRVEIPAIGVDSTIVQGVDWDQLKKGVGQLVSSTQPGENGNLVLAAHNDIFGEIFRHLDKLAPGDEIIVSTERSVYRYVVRKIDVVKPTDVQVMSPTEHAQTTLISCYPYQINTERIVVFADLITGEGSS